MMCQITVLLSTRGYWKNEEATQSSFAGAGMIQEGDLGLRRDGKIFIIDGKKVSDYLKQCKVVSNIYYPVSRR